VVPKDRDRRIKGRDSESGTGEAGEAQTEYMRALCKKGFYILLQA
jgi:hypothetical protein